METPSGLTELVTTFSSNFTASNFWGAISPFAGIIATLVIFTFSYRIIKKVVSGASKGKGKF